MADWRNRIVGHGDVPVDQLTGNPKNWRVHPRYQQDALLAVIERVGLVDDVIVNQRTGFLVDGHLRAQLADREGQTLLPAKFVDLTDEEEDLILATFDPIGALAQSDLGKRRELEADAAARDRALEGVFHALHLSAAPPQPDPRQLRPDATDGAADDEPAATSPQGTVDARPDPSFAFDPTQLPVSDIRLLQLFYAPAQYDQLLAQLDALERALGTSGTSLTVLEAIAHAHAALAPAAQ